MEDLTIRDALAVGLAQVLALIQVKQIGIDDHGWFVRGPNARDSRKVLLSAFYPGHRCQRASGTQRSAGQAANGILWIAGCRYRSVGFGGLCVDLVPAPVSAHAFHRHLHRVSPACGHVYPAGARWRLHYRQCELIWLICPLILNFPWACPSILIISGIPLRRLQKCYKESLTVGRPGEPNE